MYQLIQLTSVQYFGKMLNAKQTKKVAKSLWKNGIEPSEETVKTKIQEVLS